MEGSSGLAYGVCRKLVDADQQLGQQHEASLRRARRRLAGARPVPRTNTCVSALVRAGEGVQARGASAWVLCGYWGVRW